MYSRVRRVKHDLNMYMRGHACVHGFMCASRHVRLCASVSFGLLKKSKIGFDANSSSEILHGVVYA